MHDPKTVAFEIPRFWTRPDKDGWRPSFVTIWHVDPEHNGDDDSCGWIYPNLSEAEKALAEQLIDNEYDNLRHWFIDCQTGYEGRKSYDDHSAVSRIMRLFRLHKRLQRPWWRHPRWHIIHIEWRKVGPLTLPFVLKGWELQIHPLQQLRRRLFDRCCVCGGRFERGQGVHSDGSDRTGFFWKSKPGLSHLYCNLQTTYTRLLIERHSESN